MRSVQEFLRYNDARYLEITMDDGGGLSARRA